MAHGRYHTDTGLQTFNPRQVSESVEEPSSDVSAAMCTDLLQPLSNTMSTGSTVRIKFVMITRFVARNVQRMTALQPCPRVRQSATPVCRVVQQCAATGIVSLPIGVLF